MFKKFIITLTLVALLAQPVLAQESPTSATSTPTPSPTGSPTATSEATPTPTSSSQATPTPRKPENATDSWHPIFGDPYLYVHYYTYNADKNQMFISFESDRAVLVRISAPADDSGRGTVINHVADKGRSRVTVPTTNGKVWISTKDSLRSGVYTELDDSGANLFPDGPYSKSDMRDVGIGSALAVGIALIYEAVRVKSGIADGGERVA